MKLLAILALICAFALIVSAVENEEKSEVANTGTAVGLEDPIHERAERAARRHRRRHHRRHGRRHRRRHHRRHGRRHGRRHHRRHRG
ncbi:hypothetical protein M3Y99_01169400 [Aphelenchoides fujianensis]|nr:hypothetical protein M3Y99_01169400 [Aphelenchoides fujianensis]